VSAAILIATRSAGKLRELVPLFAARGLRAVGLEEWGVPYDEEEAGIESFGTYEENARAKATYFYEVSGGVATVADDSGLEVEALSGAPGVRSKRWAQAAAGDVDAANNAMLEREVAGVADRRARYVCAAVYVGLGREVLRRGEVAGEIVVPARGVGGFGYDPYFFVPELGRTFAEVNGAEKAAVSHRGRAFRALIDALVEASPAR
jgi:XTP/dITP diphosphohydrolase